MATVRHDDIWKFSEEEKKQSSEAIAHALSFRNIPISPEAQAWLGVAGVMGSIVGGKLVVIKMKKAMGAKSASAPPTSGTARPTFSFVHPTANDSGEPKTD